MLEKLEQHEIDMIVEKENRKKGIVKLLVQWWCSKRRTKKFVRHLQKKIEKDKDAFRGIY